MTAYQNAARIRLGMLTPSSNTILEPVTAQMLSECPNVTAHFSRFRVTEIALSDVALRQFDDSVMMLAAELLADAKVDAIAWNGTSAAWLGFESDERLCERITSVTGIKACTSVLAFRDVFARTSVRRVGLVTPYTGDVQNRIAATWKSSGVVCSAERHLGLRDNFAFAEIPETRVADMVRAVAGDGCEAVAIVCTNMHGARIAAALEAEFGIPVYDSVAVTLWAALWTAGAQPQGLAPWGSLFRDHRLMQAP
ncbi:MAG: aspartate/glutamate racemase family protein [Beijerinckiaceae bacterium]